MHSLPSAAEPATILFDGACNFCNGSVRFIMANDPAGHFRFAALDSPAGRLALRAAGRDPSALTSIVVIDADGVAERSAAALRILAGLRFPLSLLAGLRVVPEFVRDQLYGWIARNRYRWFGRATRCVIPAAGERWRFL